MGLRFRRSVRLFPGVRLNFSASGISTTLGVRGATVTLGSHGTHLNVGLPGTGISYRTPVLSPWDSSQPARPSVRPTFQPPPDAVVEEAWAPGERQLHSAPVGTLTSHGLSELKRLINEASVRRVSLVQHVAAKQTQLKRARSHLNLARLFVIRLATTKATPKLVLAVAAAEEAHERAEAELEGCIVEVDFGFDDNTLGTYASLTRAFGELCHCDAIWDITSSAAINRIVERTVATTSIRRAPVGFEFASPEIVKSRHQVLRLGNVGGRDLQIYPGFIMMRDASSDFALVEFRELDMHVGQTRFLEEERVPHDSKIVGETWKKANKDGSPDRRFRENRAIQIVEYGELVLRSPTGLLEAYLCSSYRRTMAFGQAFENHRQALATIAAADNMDTFSKEESEASSAGEDEIPEPLKSAVANVSIMPAKSLWLDWVALILLVSGVGIGGYHAHSYVTEPKPSLSSQPALVPEAIAQPMVIPPIAVRPPGVAKTVPEGKSHKGPKHHRKTRSVRTTIVAP